MPMRRRFGGTWVRRAEENTTRSPIWISPAVGRSSPATARRVVVLPQPLGPSSVTNAPAGTSNDT
jgi:hypothetical protein